MVSFVVSLAVSTACDSWGLGTTKAEAQVLDVCTGLSIEASAITDIIGPVITGAVVPIDGVLNNTQSLVNIIANLPLLGVGGSIPPTEVDVPGLLTTAANGAPIGITVLDADGNPISPSDDCVVTADGVTLATEKGVSIGGHQITGLGANGFEADAGEINSIAIGNSAATDATAPR